MAHSYLLLALLLGWWGFKILLNHRLNWVIMVIWHSIPITVSIAMVVILVHTDQLGLLVWFVFFSLLAILAIPALAVEVGLVRLAHLLPQIARDLVLHQFLVDSVGQAWRPSRRPCPLRLSLVLRSIPGLAPCLRGCGLVVHGAIAETAVLFTVPLEDLRLILLSYASTLKWILLEKQIERAIATTSLRNMHQLVVIPVLTQDFFRPGCLTIKQIYYIAGAILADKRAKEYDGVRA